MGQYFIPTIFRKDSNISEIYARYEEDKENFAPSTEKPVAALLSHDFKYKLERYDGTTCMVSIGMKFMEHCYIGNPLCRAVEYLLANDYAGCPVVWGGEYSEEEIFQTTNKNDEVIPANAYMVGKPITKQTFAALPAKPKRNRWYRYLINHDTKEYVKLPRCSSKKYQIHPLPLLTCDSYTDGCDENERLGAWRGHHLSVSNKKPALYTELVVDLTVKD